jgi:Lon-like ATP-dependent protease
VPKPADGELAVDAEAVLKTMNVADGSSTAAELEEAQVSKTYYTDAAVHTSALESLIRWYCREAGVRNLQKHVEKICRKLVTRVVEQDETSQSRETSKNDDPARSAESSGAVNGDQEIQRNVKGSADLQVTEDNLSQFVGKPLFTSDRLYEQELPAGTVTGLAWTAMGGSVLYMEAMALPRVAGNKGSATPPSVTGQLGNVMKESSQISHLVGRRALAKLLPQSAFFEEHDIYLHCPEGATPKDGPSAGVTMTTAFLSLALDRPVDGNIAMSGEVSLNGKVLPVGGIKEKTIAARRAGCNTLIFPQANWKDVDELPEYLREGLQVHFAADYSDVLRVAFPELAQQEPVDSPSAA